MVHSICVCANWVGPSTWNHYSELCYKGVHSLWGYHHISFVAFFLVPSDCYGVDFLELSQKIVQIRLILFAIKGLTWLLDSWLFHMRLAGPAWYPFVGLDLIIPHFFSKKTFKL